MVRVPPAAAPYGFHAAPRDPDVVTEPPREPSSSRGGRHVEFGIALARSKRLIVVGHRENVFHWLHMVEFYSEWLELLRKLYIERRARVM